MKENLRYLPISTGVRPAKVAILVNINSIYWESDCLAIISLFNRMWGGHYNLIIPTDGYTINTYFSEILKKYDPDYIYYYVSTRHQLKQFDSKQFEILLENYKQSSSTTLSFTKKELAAQSWFLREKLREFTISDQLMELLKNNLQLFKGQEIRPLVYSEEIGFPLTDITKILKYSGVSNLNALVFKGIPTTKSLLLHSNTGLVDTYLEESLRNEGINLNFNEIQSPLDLYSYLDAIFERDKTFNKNEYGFNISSANLEYYYNSFDIEDSPPVMVIGNTISDFCLYYCLSRLKYRVYWLPLNLDFQDELYKIVNTKRQFLKYEDYRNLELISCSLQDEEINNIMMTMEREAQIGSEMLPYKIEHRVDSFINNILFVYNKDNHTNEQVLLFDPVTNQSIYPIDTPVPIYFSKVLPYGHFWITDISVKNTIFPKNQYLATELLSGGKYDTRYIRITNKGVSYFSPNSAYFYHMGDNIKLTKINPYFKYPNTYHLFQRLFGSSGYYIKKSDKGNFEEVFIDKFQGIDSLAEVLLSQGYRKVFDKFIDNLKNEPGVYTNGIVINKRRYLDFDTIFHLIDDSELVSKIMNNLLEKDVIERGFIFKCQNCRNADWYKISDVSSTFECTRCYQVQNYNSQTLQLQPETKRIQPIWFYKLNEMIYQAYSHNSLVPILTLARLKQTSSTFQYIPEIEIRQDVASSKPTMEIDISCVMDGNIVIGECKKGNYLKDKSNTDEDVIKKYLKLAEKIGAHIIVFSTLENWSKSTLELLKKYQCESKNIKIKIYQRNDLQIIS